MNRSPIHQPPPPSVVEALTRAGVSFHTAMAMSGWKAAEVLALLRPETAGEGSMQAYGRRTGTW